MIHKAVQQMGFRRFKRGYKADRLAQITRADNAGHKMRDPTDPYFPYQWYLVSNSIWYPIYYFIQNINSTNFLEWSLFCETKPYIGTLLKSALITVR